MRPWKGKRAAEPIGSNKSYGTDHPRQVEKEENMKGKHRYIIDIVGSNDITVNEIFDQLPIGSITEDENGRKHEIKIPLVSHNGKHVIERNINHDVGQRYYDELPVSKVSISEFEWKIFLKKRRKNEKTGRYGGCIERERATA